jgi:hypothetical protein
LAARVTPQRSAGSLTFANVQLARVAPDGPFHIYEDYMIQTMPLAYDVGGCIAGAWLCDGDAEPFDGVTVVAYPSSSEILSVSSSTSGQGPGGAYGDATYQDLRIGGVEIIVRNLIDIAPVTEE